MRRVFTPGTSWKIVPPALSRYYATKLEKKMCGWQAHGYGSANELQLFKNLKLPKIVKANECLIKVRTTSVNPIDVAMLGGYGSNLLNAMRLNPEIEFPLTFGREFCGEIKQMGMREYAEQYDIGDRVWGVVPVHMERGAHAEYVVVPETCFSRAPSSLSDEEAAAVLYAGLTAWSGLFISGGLGGTYQLNMLRSGIFEINAGGKRVLVIGGSGSVGSLAIQILKAVGAEVVSTCNTDAIDMVKSSGANVVIDYSNPLDFANLKNYAPYDIILDCAGQGASFAKNINFKFNQYITFSSPLLRNIDENGLSIGIAKNIQDILESNVISLSNQNGLVKWAFFLPSTQGIKFLHRLVEREKLLPNIDSVYNFEELPEAFQHVKKGHLRGKVIVKL